MPGVLRILLVSGVVMFLGCSPTRNIYKQVMEDKESCNTRVYQAANPLQLHQSVVRALLSKKFVLDQENPAAGTLTAKRFFSKSYQNVVVSVHSKILTRGDKEQVLFLNALQTTERNYVADRTRYFLFIIPLPGGGGKEVSKSTESEMAIEDKAFYDDLFENIQKDLNITLAEDQPSLSGQIAVQGEKPEAPKLPAQQATEALKDPVAAQQNVSPDGQKVTTPQAAAAPVSQQKNEPVVVKVVQ